MHPRLNPATSLATRHPADLASSPPQCSPPRCPHVALPHLAAGLATVTSRHVDPSTSPPSPCTSPSLLSPPRRRPHHRTDRPRFVPSAPRVGILHVLVLAGVVVSIYSVDICVVMYIYVHVVIYDDHIYVPMCNNLSKLCVMRMRSVSE
jgi:hypothetical protein